HGVDLFVAHTSLTDEQLRTVIETCRIAARLDGNGVTSTGIGDDQPRSGAIHMMTSGTSGTPKVARHSLTSLLQRVSSGRSRQADGGGRWLLRCQPTGFAGVQVQLRALAARGAIVVPEERTPAAFHAVAVSAGVTHVSATPTFWRALLMLVRQGELQLQQVTL